MTRIETKPAIAAVKDLLGGHPDQLREVVRAVMQEMLEAEVEQQKVKMGQLGLAFRRAFAILSCGADLAGSSLG